MGDGHQTSSKSPQPFNPARETDERGRVLPSAYEWRQAHVEELNQSLDALAEITDETDTDEVWDEVLRNLGVDPATGGPLES